MADIFDLACVAVAELLGPVEEDYTQEHTQSDIRTEADQHRRWPVSSKYTSSV